MTTIVSGSFLSLSIFHVVLITNGSPSGYSPSSLEGIVHYTDECDSSNRCIRCQGDCDSDSDCESGLKCFQRDGIEAVPGCIGEGGTYDSAGRDICYSTSPVPTPPTPTPPTPTPPTPTGGGTCEDSPFRFKVVKDGKKISRDCKWVANRATKSRCKLTGVKEICPSTCDNCSECSDSFVRFQFILSDKKVTRDCTWVANRATKSRCRIEGIKETCRFTCDNC